MRYATSSALADGLGKAFMGLTQGDAVERRAYNDKMSSLLEQELTRAQIEGQHATTGYHNAQTQKLNNSMALMDPGALMEAVAFQRGVTVPQVEQATNYARTGQWGEGVTPMDNELTKAILQTYGGTQLAGYASDPLQAPTAYNDIANISKTSGLPGSMQDRHELFGIIENPNSPPWQVQAARVALNLDPKPSSAGAKVVMIEVGGGRKMPVLQYADGTMVPYTPQSPGAGAPPPVTQPATPPMTQPAGVAPEVPPAVPANVPPANIPLSQSTEEKAFDAAFGRERAKVAAQQVQGAANAPQEIDEMGAALSVVDQMIAHPGRKAATGGSSMWPTRPGSDAADFEAKLDQLKGLAFLIQREKLKGSGTVTDFESSKAEAALAALQLGMSEDGFLQELQTIREVFNNIKIRKQMLLETGGAGGQMNLGDLQPPGTNPPPVNARGWRLMKDAHGNRAYVGPNGEVEEI